MRHIDLFSGIGGFALACEWVGVEKICFVEIDKFCQKVLKKHWPDVPIIEDVNNVEEIKQVVANATQFRDSSGSISGCSCEYQELQGEFRGSDRQPDNAKLLLTAGFPCQPFSNAGRKRGASDNRYLWPQTLTVIEAIRPDWIVLENVPGILNMVFPDSAAPVASQATLFNVENDEICDYNTISGGIERDLRQAGYETVWLVIPACSLGAPHRRDRVWIIANAKSHRDGRGRVHGNSQDGERQDIQAVKNNGHKIWSSVSTDNAEITRDSHAPDTQRERLERANTERMPFGRRSAECCDIPGWSENWYEVATKFCRVDARVPNRVDRLKSLGNAIVPQVAYQILKAIIDIQESR
jgi:DNA (cytosine-5)-methyltransferase 1